MDNACTPPGNSTPPDDAEVVAAPPIEEAVASADTEKADAAVQAGAATDAAVPAAPANAAVPAPKSALPHIEGLSLDDVAGILEDLAGRVRAMAQQGPKEQPSQAAEEPQANAPSLSAPSPSSPGFAFGAAPAAAPSPSSPSFEFGAAPAAASPSPWPCSPSFAFGAAPAASPSPSSPSFAFGAAPAAAAAAAAAASEGLATGGAAASGPEGDRIACLEKQVATLMRLHKRHMQSRKEEVTDMLMYAGNHQFYWPGINAVGGRGRGRGQGQQPESAQLKMEKYLDELCDDLEMSPKDFLRWLLEHPLQKQSLQPLPPCASMAVRERLAEYIKAYTECVVFLDEQDRAILARPNMFYDARHIEKPRGNWFETRFKPKEPWFVSWLQAQRASGRIMRRSADAERAAGCSQQSDQQDLGLYSELHEVNLVGEVRFYFRHMKASPP